MRKLLTCAVFSMALLVPATVFSAPAQAASDTRGVVTFELGTTTAQQVAQGVEYSYRMCHTEVPIGENDHFVARAECAHALYAEVDVYLAPVDTAKHSQVQVTGSLYADEQLVAQCVETGTSKPGEQPSCVLVSESGPTEQASTDYAHITIDLDHSDSSQSPNTDISRAHKYWSLI